MIRIENNNVAGQEDTQISLKCICGCTVIESDQSEMMEGQTDCATEDCADEGSGCCDKDGNCHNEMDEGCNQEESPLDSAVIKHWFDAITIGDVEQDIHTRFLKNRFFDGETQCVLENCEDRNPQFDSVFDLMRHIQGHCKNPEWSDHHDYLLDITFCLLCLEGRAMGDSGLSDEEVSQLQEEDTVRLQSILGYERLIENIEKYAVDGDEDEDMENVSEEFLEYLMKGGKLDGMIANEDGETIELSQDDIDFLQKFYDKNGMGEKNDEDMEG